MKTEQYEGLSSDDDSAKCLPGNRTVAINRTHHEQYKLRRPKVNIGLHSVNWRDIMLLQFQKCGNNTYPFNSIYSNKCTIWYLFKLAYMYRPIKQSSGQQSLELFTLNKYQIVHLLE